MYTAIDASKITAQVQTAREFAQKFTEAEHSHLKGLLVDIDYSARSGYWGLNVKERETAVLEELRNRGFEVRIVDKTWHISWRA